MPQSKATQLISLFHNQEFGWIVKPNSDDPNVKWQTINSRPLSTGEFLSLHQNPEMLLGMRFGNETRHILADIDKASYLHPKLDLLAFHKFLNQMEDMGLTDPIIGQSSDSGGIHVYWIFDRPIPTFGLAAAVRQFLIERNFQIADGQLEIYPNPKRYNKTGEPIIAYKAHRLPAQPNSGWVMLDRDGDILPSEIECLTGQAQTEHFIQCALASQQDMELLTKQIAKYHKRYLKNLQPIHYYQVEGQSSDGLSPGAAQWRENLAKTIEIGFTSRGQTNKYLSKVLQYVVVFEGITDLYDQHERIKEIVINSPGYTEYCGHQHEIDRRIDDWVKKNARDEMYTPYCSSPARRSDQGTGEENGGRTRPPSTQRQDDVINRLNTTLTAIKEELGALPDRVGDLLATIQTKGRELFGLGFSPKTLNRQKYRSIWHPKFNLGSQDEEEKLGTQSEQAILPILVKEKNSIQMLQTLVLKAILPFSALIVVFVFYAPSERSVAVVERTQTLEVSDTRSKEEEFPPKVMEEVGGSQEVLFGAMDLRIFQQCSETFIQDQYAQVIDQNNQKLETISSANSLSPTALDQLAINLTYESPPLEPEIARSDQRNELPVVGMPVIRRSHSHQGTNYLEVQGTITNTDGFRTKVVSIGGGIYYISDTAWLATWFPAPS